MDITTAPSDSKALWAFRAIASRPPAPLPSIRLRIRTPLII